MTTILAQLRVVAGIAAIALAVFAPASSNGAGPAAATTALKAVTDTATGLTGYQDANGAWTISPRFRSGSDFDRGLAIAESADAESVLIDTSGKVLLEGVEVAIWVSPPNMAEAKVSEGLLALRVQASGKVGFVDLSGKWVIRPRFADAFEFHEGLAAFRMRENGPVGFIDVRGRIVITAKFGTRFRSPPVFAEGLAAVGLNDLWPRTNLDPPGKLGYIDRRGRWVIAPKYANGESFAGGKAKVLLGEREMVITRPDAR